MILRISLICLLVLLALDLAFVKSFACLYTDQHDIIFHPLITQAFYDEDQEMLRFKLLTNVSELINDVNFTTNMYTTLHVSILFTGGEILDKYLRLCEYVTKLDPSEFPVPGQFPLWSKPSTTDACNTSSLLLLQTSVPVGSSSQAVVESVLDTSAVPYTVESVVPTPIADSVITRQLVRRQGDDSGDDIDGSNNICPLVANELILINYNMSIGKYHKFGSYDVQLSIISADENRAIIGCNRFYVTPELPVLATTGVAIAIAVLAVWMAVMGCFTLIFSPYQESHNPFLLFCSTICNAPLLNQLSPLFDDFIVFVHFLFFMAGLDVQYPGFYQPLVASIRWAALLNSIFVKDSKNAVQDNLYVTYDSNSLGSLTMLSNFDLEGDVWSNFMALFALIIGIILLITLILTLLLWLQNRENSDYRDFNSKIFYHSLGLFNRLCFFVFATPFLVLTIYIWTSNAIRGVPQWEKLISGVFFSGWMICALYFIITYIVIKGNRTNLYTSLKTILAWSALYHKYEPSKVYYFTIECFEIIAFSIVVALLKDHGIAQVTLVIALEVLSLICLIYIKPFYLKTKLNSSKVTIGIARFIISILTIPYIRNLGISERDRTFIAYLEAFFILFVIVFIFFFPSLYCLMLTINSIRRQRQGILQYDEKGRMDVPFTTTTREDASLDLPDSVSDNKFSYYREPHVKNEGAWTESLEPENSQVSYVDGLWNGVNSNAVLEDYPMVEIGETNSKTIDYSVREADYFYNASRVLELDPEVKRLWELRGERILEEVPERVSSPHQKPAKKLKWIFPKTKKKPIVKSFEVERPRQIKIQKRDSLLLTENTTTTTWSTQKFDEYYEDYLNEMAHNDVTSEEKSVYTDAMEDGPSTWRHSVINEETEDSI